MRLSDFTPTKPTQDELGLIRISERLYRDLAEQIICNISESAHRTVALRKLLESKMILIQGITHP